MRILFLSLLLLFAAALQAQTISGKVQDAEGKPMANVTVSLHSDTGTAVLKLALTKEDGVYSFSEVKPGAYRVSASHVGMQPYRSAAFTMKEDTQTLPAFSLTKAAADMQGIVVTAKKPLVEVKADKTILNVEGTVNAVGTDALDLLRKSPGVTVDKDENLSLAGKNGVQVFIDGRPSPLTGTDLAAYLKSLQSANIEAIELITNPSAKYEAAGNAGIINIRLKKNKAFGTNGSVNGGYNYGAFGKYNGGLTLNHRNKRVNLFGNYGISGGRNVSLMNGRRTTADTLFDTRNRTEVDLLDHNYKAGIDFFINPRSTLGAMVNGTISRPEITNSAFTPIVYIPNNTVSRLLVADNRSIMERNNINLNLNYSYTDKQGRSLTLNADQGFFRNESDQLQPNYYYNAAGTAVERSVIYQMIAPTDISISSIKGDWEQNFKGGRLSFGSKLSYVSTNNDFQRYDVYTTGKVLDRDRSNIFEYKENINAAYVNYNKQLKGFMIQAGLRMENTIAEGISNGEKHNGTAYQAYDSTFKRNYTDLFPSAAITYNKNPMSQLSLSFSRRIDRPLYQDLNPFEFKLDEYTFQKGNIDLRPQYTNSIGITHTYKFKLNTTLNYSHVKNLFVQLIDTAERSKAFISKRNLATQDIVNLNVSYPLMYKSFMSFLNVNTNFSKYKADFGQGREVDLDAFGFTFYSQNSIKFGKTKTWTGEMTALYTAPGVVQGSFRAKPLYSLDLGLQKLVLQGKGTIRASVSDIFRTMEFRGTTDFAGQVTHFNARWESRQVKLNFVYRFGSNQVKAARNRNTGAEEESKRAAQQGGGIGIGQ